MRLWIGLSVVIVAAVAVGVLVALRQDLPGVARIATTDDVPVFVPAGQPQPKVEVVGPSSHDFGYLEMGGSGDHAFELKNVGQSRLILSKGQISCRCTLAEISKTRLEPGETAQVRLTWNAEQENPRFQESAEILTNDRDNPRLHLVITGRITQLLGVSPESLIMTSLPAQESAEGRFLVYSAAVDEFKIVNLEWVDPATAKNFEARTEPASATSLKDLNATSGYDVVVKIKPGLPLGQFRQRLRIETDLAGKRPIEYHVMGSVVGKLAVIGGGGEWDESTGIFRIGQVLREKGAERHLKLLVRDETPLTIKGWKAHPSALQVAVGAETKLGKFATFPITITIPRGTPAINCLGTTTGAYGEVLLETDHPETPLVRILVQFAVIEN